VMWKVVVVGVAGGDEGPAWRARLKSGVVGRMIDCCLLVLNMYIDVRVARMLVGRGVKVSTPVVGISSKEKEVEAD
jgi:hypothetical protein